MGNRALSASNAAVAMQFQVGSKGKIMPGVGKRKYPL